MGVERVADLAMIGKQIIFGIVAVCYGGGILYYAQAKHIPPLVKPFVSTWWIKSDKVNRAICAVLGFGTFIVGIVNIVAGLIGWNIFPLP